ncbi:hypothetical protein EV697_10828 [Bisgaardia hudsonensis]|uniref:Uncharacterized protein n=1 Tax=Bisgaardia hudsonensis TaxID=109472 RepID=A0A4R2MSZ0_9PAST|nr:hypothetical protein [Bisgaardia hudsonensis]QLB12891.1 hypothetical protein A6A11_04340 [Bisgaardia hudsonensis]TCP11305.1 hypothetical protein EV697_10828 [Bisgaardia hudsonensis]
MRNHTIAGTLSGGFHDQGYTEKASKLFNEGSIEYAVAPRDIVATGIGLPYVSGKFSLGIGNTDTTGSNATGIPLWGIFSGDHTIAYYKDEEVISFLKPPKEDDGKARLDIINYQNKVWGQIGPKTKIINFGNGSIIENNQGNE